MASCNKCGTDVGCPCNLVSGLCNKCYINKLSQGETPEQVRKSYSPVPNFCNLTKEGLEAMIAVLNEKKELTKTDRFHKMVLRSQLNVFDKTPCKFFKIIKNIKLN